MLAAPALPTDGQAMSGCGLPHPSSTDDLQKELYISLPSRRSTVCPNLVSSAKLLRVDSIPSSRSPIKMLNRTEPSTEPWGTPLVTGHQLCLEFRGNADKFKAKLLKCLKRLSELPSTVDIPVETGVGKTVTSLQKHELVGDFVKNFTGRCEKLVPVSQKADPNSLGSEKWDYKRRSARKRHHEPSFREGEEPEEENSEPFQPSCSQSCNPDHREKKSRRTAAFSLERLHKASFKEQLREAPVAGGSKEEQRVSYGTKEQNQESGTSRKEKLPMLPQLEEPVDNHVKKQKHWDSEKSKLEKPKLSLETSDPEREKGKAESDWTNRMNKKWGSGSLESSQRKCKVSDTDNKSVGFSSHSGEREVEDEFERPTMSFESYLCYDQPQKKRKKVVKPLVSAEEKDQGHSKQNISKASTKNLSSSQKSPSHRQTSEEEAEKPPEPPKPKRIILDMVPTLPDIPLPPTQANYHLQPSVESISCSQTERKRELGRKIAVSSPVEESETGFTGRRLNSKTQVYSGSKSATLPKVMPLYQQCIRVLSNNIDSISDVGGVPFSVLEPVLERCTPEQLYRIEECNHALTEDTDQLWHNHCVHDFKNEKPEESESWREMYLRLHDTREQRLLMLVQKFRSAHANKPKGRVTQMASVKNAAKLPLNVQRRQKKFGAGGPLLPEKTKIKPVLYTSSKSHVHVNDEQSYDGPSTSNAHSVPSSGSTFSSYDPRKPPVKKIEPMMAKTIKAFKNRLSRR